MRILRIAAVSCFFLVTPYCLASGFPDPRFGVDGFALLPKLGLGGNYAHDGVADAHGRAIIVGKATFPFNREDAIVARFTRDGVPDSSFGTSGVVRVAAPGTHTLASFKGVALAEDGKLVVGGMSMKDVDGLQGGRVQVCRLLENGERDDGFGTQGCTIVAMAMNSPYDRFHDLVVQPDGGVLVYGTTEGGNQLPAIARLDNNGLRDLCFNDPNCVNGGLAIGTTLVTQPGRMALDDNGRILTTGRSNPKMRVTRWSAAGAIDLSFGVSGHSDVWLGVDDTTPASSVAVLQSGGYAVAGFSNSATDKLAGVAKLDDDGEQDLFFGDFGIHTFHFTDVGAGNQTNDIREQEDGKILVAGWTQIGTSTQHEASRDCAVARFEAMGQLDSKFGVDGKTILNSGLNGLQRFDVCEAMDIDARHIYLFGIADSGAAARFMVIRLDQDALFADQFE